MSGIPSDWLPAVKRAMQVRRDDWQNDLVPIPNATGDDWRQNLVPIPNHDPSKAPGIELLSAPAENSETRRVRAILGQNANKNFVDRILNRDKYPSVDNGDGTRSTHQMAWSEVNGKYVVYPTILWNGRSLVQFKTPRDAYDAAMRAGEYIEFNSPDEAEWFSQRYKTVWGDEQ